MKKILIIYLPFCTPASPPYSITNLYSFLKSNCEENITVLDLNLEFHKLKFPKYQKYYQSMKWNDYEKTTKEYRKITKKVYSENNKLVVDGKKPEFLNEILKKINDQKPDIVVFSIVYSSQAFYAYSLLKELKNTKTIIGGPAVNEKLIKLANKTLNNEIELLNYISEKQPNFNFPLDFSIYELNEYFTPKVVIPIKTSSSCYYKQCAFCAHFNNVPYYEYDLNNIKKTIVDSKQKYFFLIDDMIPIKRLLEIAKTLKPLNVYWACQLKPKKDMNYEILKKLRESGLIFIMWGIESGNQRILDLIKKGTNIKDMEKVLSDSHKVGIKNVAYILFGFPTETKEEFLETIDFLKKNDKNIDLVSPSVFGLQKGTEVYNNPSKFGIKKITEEKRTVLKPKITYEIEKGLTQKEVIKLKEGHKRTLDKINKYPKTMNYFREHMFCLIK